MAGALRLLMPAITPRPSTCQKGCDISFSIVKRLL
jgi:hypothetical protein